MKECPVYGIIEEGGTMSPSRVSENGIRFCKPYDISHYVDGYTIVTPENAPSHSYLRVENEKDLDDDAIIIGPNIKAKHQTEALVEKPSPKEPDTSHIPFENVIDIDEDDVDYVEDAAKNLTKDLMEVLLKQHSPLAMAGEVAQSQVSAIFRDCFNVELESNLDFENQLDFISNLDTFCFLLKKQKNIPKEIHAIVLEKTLEKMVGDWTEKTKASLKQDYVRRYRQSLENASARVKSKDGSESPVNTIGVKGSLTRG